MSEKVTLKSQKRVSGAFLGLKSTETFLIGQKFLVWCKLGSRLEKLNSTSRGFKLRAFYAQVRLVVFPGFRESVSLCRSDVRGDLRYVVGVFLVSGFSPGFSYVGLSDNRHDGIDEMSPAKVRVSVHCGGCDAFQGKFT